MQAHAHAAQAGRSVSIYVITVSSTRTGIADHSGALIRSMLEQAGHRFVGSSIVLDNPNIIGELLDQLLTSTREPRIEAIILTGGTGLSARDCTPQAVRPRLDREIVGFGELFRMLSYEQVGAAAMLSSAVGGTARGRAVFSVPGSTKACALAMEKLILPELGHICYELEKEVPLRPSRARDPEARGDGKGDGKGDGRGDGRAGEARPERLSAAQIQGEARPSEPDSPNGWRAAVRELEAEFRVDSAVEPPDSVSRLAAVRDVLWAAGERGRMRLPDGRRYLLFGYPDLSRSASKVIAVSEEADGLPEMVALHRWPRRVGICPAGGGILPGASSDIAAISTERCGRPSPEDGLLFAVEGSAVYLRRSVDGRDRVAQWDGRRMSEWEPPGSRLGTLILFWSQR